jgi:hypothetical protein
MKSCCYGFEALEPREMLAYGSFVSEVADNTGLAVVIDYTGVDPTTIGPGNIAFSANGRSPYVATSVTSVQARPNNVLRVAYRIPAYDGAWGASDTGAYTITSPPGAVLDTQGHNLQYSNLAQVWLWFGMPKARIMSYTMRSTDWLVVVQYDTQNGLDESTLDGNDLTLTGATPSSLSVYQLIHLSPTSTQVVYSFGAPGGAWSYANNGTYNIFLAAGQVADNSGRQATAQMLASYWLWFAAPRAEYLGYTAGTNDWTVSVRFSANPLTAINPATLVADGTVYASGPRGYYELGHLTTLIHNADLSYTASYRIVAPWGSWDWTDNGTYTVSVGDGRVADIDGNMIPGSNLGQSTITSTAPSATMVLPTHPTRTGWDIAVDFTDDVMVDLSSINTATVRLQGPDGSSIPLSLTSVTFQFPNVAHAIFHLTAPGGIDNGNYQVWVNDGGMQDTAGNPVAGNMLASFWLWF